MARGEKILYELQNLGGGQNDGVPPEHIQDNEGTLVRNWIPFGSKLRRRDGTTRVTSAAHGEALTSLFPFKLSTGTWLLLVGFLTGVGKLSGGGIVEHTISDGQVYSSSASPWRFRQYKNEILACRPSTGTLKRVTQDTIQDAGIDAPSAAPTIAEGAAGDVEAGDYLAVFTFYNSTTGAESNPSPATGTVTIGASKRIAWTGIGISTNGQVTARRIYRTLPDQPGEYYFIGQIDDNFTTTFDDNVVVADMGRQVSFENALPPSNVELLEIWRERAWVSDGTTVYFSNIVGGISNVQGFGEFNVIQAYPDDGHEIRVLHAHGAQLIVGKTNAIHYVVAAGDGFALETLSDKHGCIAPESMRSAERLLFWYSGDNVYRSDGVNVVSISTVKVREVLRSIPDAMKEKVVGAVFPALSLYLLTVSQGDEDENELILAYNYKTDVWTTISLPAGIAYVGDFFDTNYGQVLYAVAYDGHVYQLLDEDALDDYGTAITATWIGKGLGMDRPAAMKAVHRIQVMTDSVPESITARVYNDGDLVTAVKERTVSLNTAHRWKRLSLSTFGRPAPMFQIELEYSGRRRIELGGLIVEAMGFRRMGRVA